MLVVAIVALGVPLRAAADELPESGGLAAGINVDPAELGIVEAFSSGGGAVGLRASVGLQIDLGPRWALRVPVVVSSAVGSGDAGFAEIDLVPGVVYRFRNFQDQRWITYLGGGLKLGAWGADREFLGQPPIAVAVARDLDDIDFDGGHSGSDANFETTVGLGLEAWAGAEWRPNRWFAFTFECTAAGVAVNGATTVAVSESIGLRLSI
jgi:hypothetical protein